MSPITAAFWGLVIAPIPVSEAGKELVLVIVDEDVGELFASIGTETMVLDGRDVVVLEKRSLWTLDSADEVEKVEIVGEADTSDSEAVGVVFMDVFVVVGALDWEVVTVVETVVDATDEPTVDQTSSM